MSRMLFKSLIRFSSQHRTLYCYMILIIWIFLLISGMYKYIGQNRTSILNSLNEKSSSSMILENVESEESLKLRKFKERCTPFDHLIRREDGGILEGWKLQGVLLVLRHGDRGPMSHIRGVENVDCGIEADALVNKYRNFVYNTTTLTASNHMFWNKIGSFHGFALLPSNDKSCLLGQLTYKGIAQMLRIGEFLNQVYANPLGLVFKQLHDKSIDDTTPHSLLNSDEVVLFTTRYRRTFQSAMAFLYSFLPPDKWLALNVREAYSFFFCFTDCACPRAEELRKSLATMNTQRLEQHPAHYVMQWIGGTLLEYATNPINDPNEVIDAMLTILCHDAPLPCRQSRNNQIPTTPTNNIDSNDVINIDQDENALQSIDNGINENEHIRLEETSISNSNNVSSNEGCIEPIHITALASFVNWQSKIELKNAFYKQIGLMRAYGMVRHILSYILKMISGDRTKFVLYSGHDWTLQYLTAALGIPTEFSYIPYASRLAIEVYKSEARTDYYFRVVYNGKDVTQKIDFCEGGKSLRVTRDSRGNKADLCPIENIIRFLHEDYFSPLNATNFKDACYATSKANEL